jgi:hypothetical protein
LPCARAISRSCSLEEALLASTVGGASIIDEIFCS